jgi:hypothetical protein
MPPRIRLVSLLVAALASSAQLPAANLDGSTPEVGSPEAARLYEQANDYVTTMAEGSYSYSYLQFYWKHAESNVERARRVYPDSPTAKALSRGDLKLGPYPLDYFKERVLFNLERKRLGAFDDVNCAIYLYGLDEKRNDPIRDEALVAILEVMARRQRWGEVMAFPVLDEHRPLLLQTIFRVAADYDQKKIVDGMLKAIRPDEKYQSDFNPSLPRPWRCWAGRAPTLYRFVADHPDAAVRQAALEGIIEREVLIRRMERLRIAFNGAIQTVHLVVQNTSLRDDVAAVAARLYSGDLDAAQPQLAVYFASQGRAPASADLPEAHLAYLQFLADSGRMGDVATYVSDNSLSGQSRRACQLKAIEIYAEAGETSEAEAARRAFSADFTPDADAAALAEFRGRMDSSVAPFEARKDSFADLPITDPCVMAVAIMDWSLSPNRSQRGATPLGRRDRALRRRL